MEQPNSNFNAFGFYIFNGTGIGIRIYPKWLHFNSVCHSFGWNCIQNFAFGENGNNLRLFELKNTPPEVTISYAAFFTMLLLPKIGAILGNYLLMKRYPKVGLEKSLK